MANTRSHAFIPDCQIKAGVPNKHLTWLGKYIAERAPDVCIFAGDFWDMPSLSSWDKGKRASENRRYKSDVEAGNVAMDMFNHEVKKRPKAWKKMRRVITLGNHEQRIERATEDDAYLEGTLSYDDLNLAGMDVYPFLEVVNIDGIAYSHFFPRSANGSITQSRRGAPSARAQCIREGGSASSGHQQGLDITPVVLGSRLQWGLIAGSFYMHDEHYLTPQGHNYWKGIVMKHDVHKGQYAPMLVDMAYFKRRFG